MVVLRTLSVTTTVRLFLSKKFARGYSVGILGKDLVDRVVWTEFGHSGRQISGVFAS